MAEGTSNPDEPDLKCYHMLKYSRFGEFGGAYGQFRSPWGAAISTGLEIIVADTKNNRLQILDLEGNFKRQIQGVDQFGLPFPKHPVKLAVDFRNGNIFMVEVDCYHGIVMFNSDEEMLSSIGDFNYPANAVCLTVDNKSNVLLVEQCESSIFLKIMRMTEPHSRIDISAHVKRPNSIAASDETFYITDCEIKAVQILSYDGAILGEIGKEGVADWPIGVAVDATGLILVVNYDDGLQLNKFTKSGIHCAAFKSKTVHRFINHVAIQDDLVVVCSNKNTFYVYKYKKVTSHSYKRPDWIVPNTFRRQTLSLDLSFSLKGYAPGPRSPMGVAASPCDGLYVADTQYGRIQCFDGNGEYLCDFPSSFPNSGFTILDPRKMTVDPNNLNLIVMENTPTAQIVIFDRLGRFIQKFGSDDLINPISMAADRQNRILVLEDKSDYVKMFNRPYVNKSDIHCGGLIKAIDIAVNENYCIFIADQLAHCVKVFTYSGVPVRMIGRPGITNYPTSVAMYTQGILLIGSHHTHRINLTFYSTKGNFMSAFRSEDIHHTCNDLAVMESGRVAVVTEDNAKPVLVYFKFR